MALPSGYTELQWIASNGNQHFKTGVFPTENTSIEVEISGWPPSQGTSALFGTQSSASDRFDLFITSDGLYRSYWGGSGSVTFDASVSCENDVLVVRNKADISIGAATLSNSARTFTCATELYLFAHNNNGTPNKRTSLQAKRWRIRENGTLIRDYIPCLNSSGVAGLYDNVSGSFSGSASTTAFVAGPVAATGPQGSRPLLDGVDYGIAGGRSMISGAVYDIWEGKTMLDGAVYTISLGEPPPTIITFTYKNSYVYKNATLTLTLHAEEGMTWRQFCDSAYDASEHDFIIIYGDQVYFDFRDEGTDRYAVELNGVNVVDTDLIVANAVYGS